MGDKKNGHVAHHFAGRRYFHDVAESQVDVGVGARDLVPARAQPHGLRLLLEICVLAAGHLVDVDLRGAAGRPSVERRVNGANGLPVVCADV